MAKAVYLAGPEVFLPNARAILDEKIALTRAAGLVPVAPGDLEFPPTDTHWQLGLAIAAIDEKLMRSADAIIANLTPFRGLAADTGTTFELGFMCALGCPVFAYTNVAQNHGERLRAHYGDLCVTDDAGRLRGPDGLAIEDFGFADNLMLHGGVLNRDGALVVGNAAPGTELTDLTAFREILAIAAARLA